jgi:putative hemolysin
MSGVLPQLGAIGVILIVHALAAGTETALRGLTEGQLQHLDESLSQTRRLVRIFRSLDLSLIALRSVRAITLLGIGVVATNAFVVPLNRSLEALGSISWIASVGLVGLGVAFAVLVLGDLVPNRIAVQRAEQWSLGAAFGVSVLVRVTTPFIWVLQRVTAPVVRLLGFDPVGVARAASVADVRLLLSAAYDLDADRRMIVEGAFALADHTVRDVLIPRCEIFVLDADATSAQARSRMAQTEFSRAPVCLNGKLDAVVGMVHVKQLVTDDVAVIEMAHPMTVLVENSSVLAALRLMQYERAQIAIVVDEHGAVVGLVAMEDLLEEIVGEIFDETDNDAALIADDGDARLVVSGRALISKLRLHGVDFPVSRSRTVGGFIQDRLGRMVRPGDTVLCDDFELEVLTIRGRVADDVAVRRGLVC